MGKRKKILFITLLTILIGSVFIPDIIASAVPDSVNVPDVNISFGQKGSPKEYVQNIKIFIFFTMLAILPSLIIMVTSYTKSNISWTSFISNNIYNETSLYRNK